MKKESRILIITIAVITIIIFIFVYKRENVISMKSIPFDPRNETYIIDGVKIKLKNGASEDITVNNQKISTNYREPEIYADIDGDKRVDSVFILTQKKFSGEILYFISALLDKERGPVSAGPSYIGTDINEVEIVSKSDYIIVTYRDKENIEGSPMPPIRTILYKLNLTSQSLEEVASQSDYENSSTTGIIQIPTQSATVYDKRWYWQKTETKLKEVATPDSGESFAITFNRDNTFSATTDCNTLNGKFVMDRSSIKFEDIFNTEMYCDGSFEQEYKKSIMKVAGYEFSSERELILITVDGSRLTYK